MDQMQNQGDIYALSPDRLPKKAAPAGGRRPFLLAIVLVVGLVAVGLVVNATGILRGGTPAQATGVQPNISADQEMERAVTSFLAGFLPLYFNYSYTTYDAAVKRVATMMTPELQQAYNSRALDRDFITLLRRTQSSTDGFRIIENSVRMGREGNNFYVQLSGALTYTTGSNGASADWPMNLLVKVVKTDKGFLVGNVQRTR